MGLEHPMSEIQRHFDRYFLEHEYTRLCVEDYNALRAVFDMFYTENGDFRQCFTPLQIPNKHPRISYDLTIFQSLSCSFFLFIKAFLCKSGNDIELFKHKPPLNPKT